MEKGKVKGITRGCQELLEDIRYELSRENSVLNPNAIDAYINKS